jgi:hypothetical protein
MVLVATLGVGLGASGMASYNAGLIVPNLRFCSIGILMSGWRRSFAK